MSFVDTYQSSTPPTAAQFIKQYRLIQGFDSDSASRTDILDVEDLKTGMHYIMKLFVIEFKSYDQRKKETHSEVPLSADLLVHELNIYLALRTRLVEDPSVNARNILCIAGHGELSIKDLYEIVRNGATALSGDNIRYNLYRNLLFLLRLGKEKKRNSLTRVERNPPIIQETDLLVPYGNVDVVRLDKPISYAFFMTPKIDRMSLADAVENGDIRRMSDLMQYLFVIAITLQLMSAVGVNQNDLHWGNILLSKSYFGPSPYHKRIYLMFLAEENRLLLINNPGVPLIYDFDRAVTYQGSSAEFTDYIMKGGGYLGGNCVHFNPKRDFLKMLCCLWHYCRDIKTTESNTIRNQIMQDLIWNDEIKEAIRTSHHGCWMTSQDQSYSLLCVDDKVNKGMATRDAMIRWIAGYCAFSSCTLTELRSAANDKAQSSAYQNVKAMITMFKSDMNPKQFASLDVLKSTIRCNIQVVGGSAREKVSSELTELVYALM